LDDEVPGAGVDELREGILADLLDLALSGRKDTRLTLGFNSRRTLEGGLFEELVFEELGLALGLGLALLLSFSFSLLCLAGTRVRRQLLQPPLALEFGQALTLDLGVHPIGVPRIRDWDLLHRWLLRRPTGDRPGQVLGRRIPAPGIA
jgi:hypothetical protein